MFMMFMEQEVMEFWTWIDLFHSLRVSLKKYYLAKWKTYDTQWCLSTEPEETAVRDTEI